VFTGLIREIGTLRRVTNLAKLSRLEIAAPDLAPQLSAGDSLAVNGICLTAAAVRGDVVTVEAAVETRRATTLRRWRAGQRLHLEPALRAGQPLDGHLVLGHVDGTGRVIAVRRAGASLLVTIVCGEVLAAWLLPKGSVAVDGVSLTADAGPHLDRFTVNLIPHTVRWTRLGEVRPGRTVNLEMDVLAKAARSGRPAAAFAGLGAATAPPAAAAAAGPGRVPSIAYILDRGFGRRGNR